MIKHVREKFNASFSEERYQDFLQDINQSTGHSVSFRVAESPLFVSKDFKNKLRKAADEILKLLSKEELKKSSEHSVPERFNVPNETERPLFIALDFAVTKDDKGELQPRLIELQGFPSLFGWQDFLPKKFKEYFKVPGNFNNHFVKQTEFERIFTEAVLGKEEPQHVILLEIDPLKQTTGIDFTLTEKLTGIRAVHIGELRREGRKLFYNRDGKKTQVRRIYNRVIFDELIQRKDLFLSFNLTEEVDATWAGHPNWFFKISKCIMPYLKSEYVPLCRNVSELDIFPENPEDYVLKPLYSFSGSGVIFNLTKKDLDSIPRKARANFILQKKVNYEPVLQAPDGLVKAEIRLMFIWENGKPTPTLITNLVRLSRGEMIGVKYNKDKTWVGGSVCFFEP
jgi:hypothetical protein